MYLHGIYIYIYLHIYIYIAHDLPPYVKPLDHMRPDADPEPLVRGLLLMESVASAPNFFSIRRAKIGQLRVELIHDDVHFSIHIYSIYIYRVYM